MFDILELCPGVWVVWGGGGGGAPAPLHPHDIINLIYWFIILINSRNLFKFVNFLND
jgi:hypothetical protein